MVRVAGAGICCMDYIVVAPHVDWGDMAVVTDYLIQGGGLVGTAMVACARLGAKCDLYSLLGDDLVGKQIIEELDSEGVSTCHVARVQHANSPFSFVHVDEKTADRTIFHRPGQGLVWDSSMGMTSIADAQALLVDDYFLDLSLFAAKEAREHGVPVIADLIPAERNAELLKYVDVLIAPRHYARLMGCDENLDAALDAIHAFGPATALITLGSDGWVYSDPTGRGRGDAFKVDVVDTTGAGDTFHGAFTYAVARDWQTPRCAEFASAVAAIKCTKHGGRTGLPSLSQTMEFLREHGRCDWG